MTGEFLYVPRSGSSGDDRTGRSGRRSVRHFLMGFPDDVEGTILELHLKQYAEVGLWSRSLTVPEIEHEFLLHPGEVMRVYKRYLTR